MTVGRQLPAKGKAGKKRNGKTPKAAKGKAARKQKWKTPEDEKEKKEYNENQMMRRHNRLVLGQISKLNGGEEFAKDIEYLDVEATEIKLGRLRPGGFSDINWKKGVQFSKKGDIEYFQQGTGKSKKTTMKDAVVIQPEGSNYFMPIKAGLIKDGQTEVRVRHSYQSEGSQATLIAGMSDYALVKYKGWRVGGEYEWVNQSMVHPLVTEGTRRNTRAYRYGYDDELGIQSSKSQPKHTGPGQEEENGKSLPAQKYKSAVKSGLKGTLNRLLKPVALHGSGNCLSIQEAMKATLPQQTHPGVRDEIERNLIYKIMLEQACGEGEEMREVETDKEFRGFKLEALVQSRITQLDEVLGSDVHKDGSYISAIGRKLGN